MIIPASAFSTGSVARHGLRDMYPEAEQC
jgi:hypothetical protein